MTEYRTQQCLKMIDSDGKPLLLDLSDESSFWLVKIVIEGQYLSQKNLHTAYQPTYRDIHISRQERAGR